MPGTLQNEQARYWSEKSKIAALGLSLWGGPFRGGQRDSVEDGAAGGRLCQIEAQGVGARGVEGAAKYQRFGSGGAHALIRSMVTH